MSCVRCIGEALHCGQHFPAVTSENCRTTMIDSALYWLSTHWPQVQRLLRSTYAWAPVPDDCWQRALEMQDQLAATSQHSGASVVDLIIAVTAMRHRLI